MSKLRIYECKPCVQLFRGRVAFDYHMNAHKRTSLPTPRVIAPKPRPVWYDDDGGEEPRHDEGE